MATPVNPPPSESLIFTLSGGISDYLFAWYQGRGVDSARFRDATGDEQDVPAGLGFVRFGGSEDVYLIRDIAIGGTLTAADGQSVISGSVFDDSIGSQGANLIIGSEGSDFVYGTAPPPFGAPDRPRFDTVYDQINYPGASSQYTFEIQGNFIRVTKPDGSIDSLNGIEGVWFSGDQRWVFVADLLNGSIQSDFSTGGLGRVYGTPGDDRLVLIAQAEVNASGGNDTFLGSRLEGGALRYHQVNYPGAVSDYTFSRTAEAVEIPIVFGTTFTLPGVEVTKPDGTKDILAGIEGVWFSGSSSFHILESLLLPAGGPITGTAGNDRLFTSAGNDIVTALGGTDVIFASAGSDQIDGGGSEYDQVDYDGASGDYTFVREGNVIIVGKPGGAQDRLTSIDGIWFSGEGAWYALADLIDGGEVNGTPGNDLIAGTRGDDLLSGLGGADVFNGSDGFDVIYGSGEGLADTDYDQVDYSGARADYRFERAGEAVHVFKPDGSRDTLFGIDGFWFGGEQQWYATSDILPQAPLGLAEPGA